MHASMTRWRPSWRCTTSGGEVDRSHRKLAHRGSYTNRVWFVPPLCGAFLLLRAPSARSAPPCLGARCASPSPTGWTNRTTGPTASGCTTRRTSPRPRWRSRWSRTLVSRKWIAEIVSAQETSSQIEIVFTDALAAKGLLALVEARADGLVDPIVDDDSRPSSWRYRTFILSPALWSASWTADRTRICGVGARPCVAADRSEPLGLLAC